MRVNASEAAWLVASTDKTVRGWCEAGRIPGAVKVKRLGKPEAWEIELSGLYQAVNGPIDARRLRIWEAWVDLHRAALNPGPNPRETVSSSPNYRNLPEPTGTSTQGSRNLVGMFGTRADAARWLLRHGVNSESTPKDWPGWRDVALDPEDVLALAIRVCDPANHRITWRLHRCDEASCVCQRML